MTPMDPHATEVLLLRRQLDAAERELDHRANVISAQADRYSRMRRVAIRRAGRIADLERRLSYYRPLHLAANPRSTGFPSLEDRV